MISHRLIAEHGGPLERFVVGLNALAWPAVMPVLAVGWAIGKLGDAGRILHRQLTDTATTPDGLPRWGYGRDDDTDTGHDTDTDT